MSSQYQVSQPLRSDKGEHVAMSIDDDDPPSKAGRALKVALILLALLVAILLIGGLLWLFLDVGGTEPEPLFVIIIDAGSSGSRAVAFTFHKDENDNLLVLDKEMSLKVTPGLSSYANDPTKGAENIVGLVDKVKGSIPENKWNETLLTLQGTAGLRILSNPEAERLLGEVNKELKKEPFQLVPAHIMDGNDEGINGWLTTAYLLNLVSNDSDSRNIAAIDLGGASMQVIFPLQKNYTDKLPGHTQVVTDPTRPNSTVNLWVTSYLNFGMNEASHQILVASDYLQNVTDLVSDCVNPCVTNATWYHGGQKFEAHNPSVGLSCNLAHSRTPTISQEVFSRCALRTKKLVVDANPQPPKEFLHKDIYAMNGFFHTARDAGLVDADKEITTLQVRDFTDAAKHDCQVPKPQYPFECLRLVYASVVLVDGFGLKPSTKIHIVNTNVHGHMMTWALGSALRLLEEKYLKTNKTMV